MPSLRDRSVAPPDVSALSEQQLGVCLLRGVARTDHLAILDEAALLVRRNPKTGSEIDFVGPLLQTPIESKYVSQKWRKERKALDEHYGRGIVATRDVLDVGEARRYGLCPLVCLSGWSNRDREGGLPHTGNTPRIAPWSGSASRNGPRRRSAEPPGKAAQRRPLALQSPASGTAQIRSSSSRVFDPV